MTDSTMIQLDVMVLVIAAATLAVDVGIFVLLVGWKRYDLSRGGGRIGGPRFVSEERFDRDDEDEQAEWAERSLGELRRNFEREEGS